MNPLALKQIRIALAQYADGQTSVPLA
jgi:hypothetical protein